MEPPSEDYQSSPRQHPWDAGTSPTNIRQQQQPRHSSRGRSSSRYQTTTHEHNINDNRRTISHNSTSNTPRRKGNPQSPTEMRSSKSPSKYNHTVMRPSSSSHSLSSSVTNSPQLTPLSTLSTILTTHASHSQTALQLYRQSHALHRHATERTNAALEKLRLAQAEVEHATTAQEYANDELVTSTVQKNDAQKSLNTICKRVRNLSKSLVNKRVRLVGLTKNVLWNGRLGTIIKLVTDGTSNDVGRWKVKLDAEWRGRDADGTKILRSDSLSLDTDGNEKHQEQEEDSSNMNVVVAKAENLELVDGEEEVGNDILFGEHHQIDVSQSQRRLARSRSRSLSKQPYVSGEEGSPYRRSRDPSVSDRQRGRNDPVSVTPENNIPSRSRGASRSGERRTQPYKDISPVNYYKSPSGRYHEEEQRSRSSSSKLKQVTRQVSPTKRTQQQEPVTWQEAQERQQQRQPRSSSVKKNSTKKQPIPSSSTPIRRTASTDSERLSTAFSRMLMSPVSFTPASFEPEPSESFQQWVVKDKNATKYVNESQQTASAGEAFFDEVTSPYTDNGIEDDYNQQQHHGYGEWEQSGEGYDNPQISMYDTPVSHEETPVTTTQDGHSLPNIVILPVEADDLNNPFLSPGYESNTPPHCVGVQNAGVPHINGVYLLAYPKDENGNAIVDTASNGGNIPPLYFKDGPPTLLGDNRYYDMCILRIDCPDSADHVIWFLARVDVDPQQLDVKFSDCYYYCRMLQNDDGCGGEVTDDDGVCHVPPFTGWNIPSIPHGVGELSISGQQQSSSFSTSTGGGGGRGIGIVPRGKTSEETTVPHFVSPGKYSV